jgi:hypothetical protein
MRARTQTAVKTNLNVDIVMLNAGSMLLVKRINKRRRETYQIISGRKRKKETNEEAACRIVGRELSLKVDLGRFKPFGIFTMLLEIDNDEWKRIRLDGVKYASIALWSPESVFKANDTRPEIKKIAHDIMTKLSSRKIL